LKQIKPNAKKTLNDTFDAVTKMYRVNLIARNFSDEIDKFIQANPGSSRKDAIDALTPQGIFQTLLDRYSLMLNNPKLNSVGKQKIQDIVTNFWELSKLATTKLSFTEDIIITIDSVQTSNTDNSPDINPEGVFDNNNEDSSSQEERIKDGWQVKHQHQSSIYSMSQ
jgi:hypothetical protein